MADGGGANGFAEQLRANLDMRRMLVDTAMPMSQPLQTQSISGTITSANNILTFRPALVGLLVGFMVEINVSANNAGGSTANRAPFGALNVIKRIQWTDLTNQTRINTTGWHLGLINSLKQGRGYGQAVAPNLPFNAGSVWNVQSMAATIAAGMSEAVRVQYWVPIAYSWDDLQGAIDLNVINATAQLQIQMNDVPGYVAGDQIAAVAGGAGTTVTLQNATVRVTQCYYDQLKSPPPIIDMATQYRLEDTTFSGIVQNNDNTFEFSNYREYLSSLAILDQAGTTLNTGSDVNYWALQYANRLRQWELNPEEIALQTRNQLGFDIPQGAYYFDHRAFPIETANYGNAVIVLNPLTAAAGTYVAMGWESFSRQQAIVGASLPSR